jgi:hypothetical protein
METVQEESSHPLFGGLSEVGEEKPRKGPV